MKALLIIDMQVGSFAKLPRYDAAGVIERINRLSAFFRYYAYPIIFIQHEGTLQDDFIPGSAGWKILPELDKTMEDIIVSKKLNDCFSGSALEKMLTDLSVTQLYITGCATDFCVDSTIRSAHTKGFAVHVVKDGHTTADRPGLPADVVIKHHNWIWENMIPNPGKIFVSPTADIIRHQMIVMG